jgi:oligopeptide transport system substrate-binding protein
MPIAFPIHEPSVTAHQRLDPRTGRLEQRQDWCKAGALISNGPYQLVRWRFKRDMLLERNPDYHRPEIVRNDSVLALTIEDANTAVLAFKAGGIDWMGDIGVDYLPDMIEQGYPNIHVTPAFATEFYSFNCRPTLRDGRDNPFADARVRRAFALAIDRERIVRHVTRLGEPVAASRIRGIG